MVERVGSGAPSEESSLELGANYIGDADARFVVWAPGASGVELHLLGREESLVTMEGSERGHYRAVVQGLPPGARYFYRLDRGRERPDPASRFQPLGVHGPSELVDDRFEWTDGDWSGLPLSEHILYELHVGSFTPEGTFEAIIPAVVELRELGITALELMPVAQFPGTRNWGYDGVYPFAVQASYGGPVQLCRLVNACHACGMAVVLDVVYNHLGPEGNYFADFGPYFTDRYRTPWGPAINLDGEQSDEVRRFFIENALYWIDKFHIDGLRLDATHAMYDFSARPFLQELADIVHQHAIGLQRHVCVFSESDRNDSREVRAPEFGGYGLDAQWNDDFHHALYARITQERLGYYEDFGDFAQIVKALKEGYVYTGQYSNFRRRSHGSTTHGIPSRRFIVFSQNHDQIGNRPAGDRLSRVASFEQLKLIAALVLLSPYTPLLFMGEEYGETAPFQYFVSHSDPQLIDAVRAGRSKEFADFFGMAEVPDPQSEDVFLSCKLHTDLRLSGQHRILHNYYRELIRLRTALVKSKLLSGEATSVRAFESQQMIMLACDNGRHAAAAVFSFSAGVESRIFEVPSGCWHMILDSADVVWGGPGSLNSANKIYRGELSVSLNPTSVAYFERQG